MAQEQTTQTEEHQADESSDNTGAEVINADSGDEDPRVLKFTQEEFERRLARAADKARRQERKNQAKSKQAEQAPEQGQGESVDEVRMLRDQVQQMQFFNSVTEYGVSVKQAKHLYATYKAQEPDDLGEWIEGLRADGVIQAPAATTRGVAPGAVDRQRNPDTSGGAPRKVSDLEVDGVIDVFALSKEDREMLGPEGLVREFERLRDRAVGQSGAPPLPKALRNRGRS